MITFICLLLALFIIGAMLTGIFGFGGVLFAIIFGEVIVFGYIVYHIIKAIIKKRKGSK